MLPPSPFTLSSAQGLCPEYDAAASQLARLQAAAGRAVEAFREVLAQRGHGAAVLKKVRLVDYRGERLLEVRASTAACLGNCLPA
jgi:hypothetical protein